MRFIGDVFFIQWVSCNHAAWFVKALFFAYRDMHVEFGEFVQRMSFKIGLMLVCRNIAERHEDRVARMIMRLVEMFELRVGQVRNLFWITATVVVIGSGRKQIGAQDRK